MATNYETLNSGIEDHSSTSGLSLTAALIQIGVTCGLVCAIVSSGVSYAITGIMFSDNPNPDSSSFHLTPIDVSLYTTMMNVGAIGGSLCCGPILRICGQRILLILSILLAIVGWTIHYCSYIFWLHCFSRFILGCYASWIYPCLYTYIAEISHCQIRGKLQALIYIGKQLGFLLISIMGSTNLGWRFSGIVCGLSPLAILSVTLMLIPNSPRWLALHNRRENEVLKSLKFYIRGKNCQVRHEYNSIMSDLADTQNSTIRYQIQLLRNSRNCKILILLTFLSFAIAFVGDAVVLSYSVMIFQSATTNISPNLSTIICSCIRIFGSFVYLGMADRLGRRPQFMIFTSFCCLSTAVLGLYFYLSQIDFDVEIIFWLPLSSLILFIFCNCLSYPVIELLKSELLPNSIRHLGMTFLILGTNLGAFLAIFTYPLIANNVGSHWAFFLYSINSLVMIIVVFIFLPETKGKTLEEISELF